MMDAPHAKLFFNPRLWVTSELVASELQISLDAADQLLGRPDITPLLQQAMEAAMLEAMANCLRGMARIPHEKVPIRIDVAVLLPSLSMTGTSDLK